MAMFLSLFHGNSGDWISICIYIHVGVVRRWVGLIMVVICDGGAAGVC